MRCYLDMDGVLCDFVGGVCQALGRRNPYSEARSAGEWEVGRLLNVPPEAFVDVMSDPSFWAELEWTDDGPEILRLVIGEFGRSNVVLLTDPSDFDAAAVGKLQWVRRNVPWLRVYICNATRPCSREWIGSLKAFLANRDTVLVDDNDQYVEAYKDRGGPAILLPRPWNSRHAIGDAVEQLRAELCQITAGQEVMG